MRPDDQARPMSRRRSITVWLAGSVLGWGLVFAALDRMLAPDGQPVAEAEPPPAAVETASPTAADILTPEELRRLREIAPAAGGMAADTMEEEPQAAPPDGEGAPNTPRTEGR